MLTWGIQELENVFTQLLLERWIDSAYGEQLDKLGVIVGESRLSDNDEEYRAAIKLRVIINVSEGEPERLITVLQAITKATLVHYLEKYPARACLYAHEILQFPYISRVQQTAPAGVHVTITASHSDDPFVFGVDRDASGAGHGSELSFGSGFGETNWPLEGGDFVDIFVE